MNFFKFGPGPGWGGDDSSGDSSSSAPSSSSSTSSFGNLFSFGDDDNSSSSLPAFKFPGANDEERQEQPPRPSFSVWSEPAEEQTHAPILPGRRFEEQTTPQEPEPPSRSASQESSGEKMNEPPPIPEPEKDPAPPKPPGNFVVHRTPQPAEKQPLSFAPKTSLILSGEEFAEKMRRGRSNNTHTILRKNPAPRVVPKSPAIWRPPQRNDESDRKPEPMKFVAPRRPCPNPSITLMQPPKLVFQPQSSLMSTRAPPIQQQPEQPLSICAPKEDPFFSDYQEYLQPPESWLDQGEMQVLTEIENGTAETLQDLLHRFEDSVLLAKKDLEEGTNLRKNVLLLNVGTFAIITADTLGAMDKCALSIAESCHSPSQVGTVPPPPLSTID